MLGPLELVRHWLPHMRTQRFGRILNITSFVVKELYPNMALSNSLRVGLTGAMGSLAREVAGTGITVNGLLPGLMDTGALQRVIRDRAARQRHREEEVRRQMAKASRPARLGTAEDFGGLCAFLASEPRALHHRPEHLRRRRADQERDLNLDNKENKHESIRTTLLAAALAAVPRHRRAGTGLSDGVVRIGVVTDMSGALSDLSGRGSVDRGEDGGGGLRRQGAGPAHRSAGAGPPEQARTWPPARCASGSTSRRST